MSRVKNYVNISLLQSYCREIRTSHDQKFIEDRVRWLLSLGQVISFNYRWSGALFRARKCDGVSRYAQVSEMHHPPPHLSKRGRLNDQGAPLLYLSQNGVGALHEIKVRPGDRVQIVEYEMPKDVYARCAVFGEITNAQRCSRSNIPGLGEKLQQLLLSLPHDVCDSFIFLDSFLSSILRDPSAQVTNYQHSSTLAKLLFAELDNLEGIIYPSVVFEGGVNLALLPSSADRLVPVRSSLLDIKEIYDYGVISFRIEEGSVNHKPSGDINWKINIG